MCLATISDFCSVRGVYSAGLLQMVWMNSNIPSQVISLYVSEATWLSSLASVKGRIEKGEICEERQILSHS